ncbi:helix-hairpin-helix domain-containing protein [Streptomyces sp. NPDC005963]|uniref:helix-hairpin-helix domain-containing protein n=1 Tax=Streptomyces sp. NPDC005963 TaxID=3156721 RepID=UPI003407D8FC
MDLRSRSATSGPGRAPASDGRARSRRGAGSTAPVSRSRPAVDFGTRPGGHGRGPAPGGPGSRTGPGRGRLHRVSRPSRPRTPASSHAVARRGAFAVFGTPSDSGDGTTRAAEGPRDRDPTGATSSGGAAGGPQGMTDTVPSAAADPARPAGEAVADEGSGHRAWHRLALATRERLPLWMQLRCGLEPKTLMALAIVFLVAAVFAVQHFWAGRPETVRAPEVLSEPVVAERTPTPGPAPMPRPEPSTAGRIVVDVAGKVRRPGVLKLPAGSRVADALVAAGGVRTGVDTSGLNRARVLVDGEQVAVGVPAATTPGPGGAGSAAADGAGVPDGPGRSDSTTGHDRTAGTMSLNTATAEELDTLPGVGPVLVQHIIDYRTQHGGFRSVDQLRDVDGIGERRFADLKPRVRP